MKQSEALKILSEKIASCTKCQELYEYRTNNKYLTVPGEGNPNAKIMSISEAPGQTEAETGRPYTGRAGELFNNIIASMGLKREQLYICNILCCRPPNNRDPKPEESKNCRSFLDMQIKIVNPKWIICWGRVSARELLNAPIEKPMKDFRGYLHDYLDKKVLCTYHPSYLLRNPSAKALVAEDLQILLEAMKGSENAKPTA